MHPIFSNCQARVGFGAENKDEITVRRVFKVWAHGSSQRE